MWKVVSLWTLKHYVYLHNKILALLYFFLILLIIFNLFTLPTSYCIKIPIQFYHTGGGARCTTYKNFKDYTNAISIFFLYIIIYSFFSLMIDNNVHIILQITRSYSIFLWKIYFMLRLWNLLLSLIKITKHFQSSFRWSNFHHLNINNTVHSELTNSETLYVFIILSIAYYSCVVVLI